MKRKTNQQKQTIKSNGLMPFAWLVINEYDNGSLLVMKWITGEFRYINK